ncbi:MAG: hypothetical protein GY801_40905 [bacterium]|nr:hypothetical protein [bacterium]
MAKDKSEFEKLFDTLARQRDELMLQLHLGKAEAKDALEELEKKWETLKDEAEESLDGNVVTKTVKAEWEALEGHWENLKEKETPLRETVGEVSEDLGAAVDLVGEELKRGYERLKKLI